VTTVFALFLLRGALGLLGMLPFVPEKAGRSFFKFTSACAATELVLALGFVVKAGGVLPGVGDPTLFLCGLVGSALCSALYNRAWHFSWAGARAPLLGAALCSGVAGLLGAAGGPLRPTALLSDLTSAWLLGAATAAMILGHYYLVVLDLPTSALRRLTVLLASGLLARTVVVLAALLGPAQGAVELALALAQGVFSADGVFVWMRILFGILGPGSLLWFIWKTVEIRSTQSATGILYVQLFLVLSGELLSTYLRVVAGLVL
jgi:hypothetical protein